jgi:hypothetical protein
MSENTSSSFTKICASCGLEKPLSAFLELSGDAAGTYGNICGTCRKSHIENLKSKDAAEGSSRTETGHKIDSKVKVAKDIDKKQTAERIEEEYHEERDENELIESDELEKKDTKQSVERKHRETFLDRRRVPTDAHKTNDSTKTHVTAQEETRERQNTQTHFRDESKKTEIDLTSPVIDTYIPGKKKFEGVAIRAFANWARGSAIGNRLGNKQPDANNPNQGKDLTLSEHIEKKWGPKR